MDGLFCEKIFGFFKDWECWCGKYKWVWYWGIVCECCGVEVMEFRVCCYCMGYIKLVVFVIYVWYFKGIFSYFSIFLDMVLWDVEQIVYFNVYVVFNFGNVSNL